MSGSPDALLKPAKDETLVQTTGLLLGTGLTHEGLRSYTWGNFGEVTAAQTLQNPAKCGTSEQIVDLI